MANSNGSGGGAGSLATSPSFSAAAAASAPVQRGETVQDTAGQVSPHSEFLYRVAERFGIPVVLLVIVLWWARNDLIQPLLDAHFSFLGKITTAHERHTEELQNIGAKLDTLIRVSDDK